MELFSVHVTEQKMALAAYAAENDVSQLTVNQLEIARKLVLRERNYLIDFKANSHPISGYSND